MNKQRRNRIAEALELISQARDILEEVKDEEQESYENLPESLQYGERGEQMQENVDSLEEFMRKRKRQVVKKLIQCAAIIAAGVLAIILFMLAIWYRGKNSEPVTDEQVAAQMQQAEPLVIETPEAATEGSIRVYDYDGCCIYSYYGKIRINSDGKDGKDIDVEAIGYLEGYQEHKDESEAGNE